MKYAKENSILSDTTTGFRYTRVSAPRSDDGNSIFTFKEVPDPKNVINKLPKKLSLIYMKGGEIIRLEYMKNTYTDLLKEEPSESDDTCFLTTACTAARGLPDDCDELQILRKFRNEILQPTQNGEELVKNYYAIAPAIVQKVNRCINAKEIWNEVYENLVVPTRSLIEAKKNEEAIGHYKEYVFLMQEIFG